MRELIYFKENLLTPKGGPAGYLYNLRIGMDQKKIDYVDFLPYEKETIKSRLKKHIVNYPLLYRTVHYWAKIKYSNNVLDMIFKREHNALIDFDKYDVIHFHSTIDMFMCKDSLKKYNGVVILTSHSPKVFHQELLDDFSSSVKKKRDGEVKEIDIIDKYAFLRADCIIFPVKESLDCYFNTWSEFTNIYPTIQEKITFLPTGTLPKKYNKNMKEFRKEYGIPSNVFLIAYVGRHNEVKGYDIVKKIACDMLKKNKDVYFIIGGQQGPLYQLNDDRWIEVGWTDDPGSIINAADVFILPNKETYFDLVMLEVLSIGTPIIASYTGGNKYFEKFHSQGIMMYKSYEELISMIENLMKMDSDNKKELRVENRNIYCQNFTNEKFAEQYLEIVNSLYEKESNK